MIGLLLAVSAAQALPPPPVVNGEPTAAWPAVGMLAAVDLEAGRGSPFCSATLVTEQALVTAAHCAVAAQDYATTYDIAFLVGSSIDDLQELVLVDDFTVHPDYVFDGQQVAADVAVAWLAEPVQTVSPMPILDAAPEGGWLSQDLIIVGFGITSDHAVDPGIKRQAVLPAWYVDADFVYALDEDDPDAPNACSGDSGGAAIVQTADGPVLGGAISFVFPWHDEATACVGGGVGATRMDVYGGWVADQASGVVAIGGGSGDGYGGFQDETRAGCASVPGAALVPGLLAPLGLVLRRRRRLS